MKRVMSQVVFCLLICPKFSCQSADSIFPWTTLLTELACSSDCQGPSPSGDPAPYMCLMVMYLFSATYSRQHLFHSSELVTHSLSYTFVPTGSCMLEEICTRHGPYFSNSCSRPLTCEVPRGSPPKAQRMSAAPVCVRLTACKCPLGFYDCLAGTLTLFWRHEELSFGEIVIICLGLLNG